MKLYNFKEVVFRFERIKNKTHHRNIAASRTSSGCHHRDGERQEWSITGGERRNDVTPSFTSLDGSLRAMKLILRSWCQGRQLSVAARVSILAAGWLDEWSNETVSLCFRQKHPVTWNTSHFRKNGKNSSLASLFSLKMMIWYRNFQHM